MYMVYALSAMMIGIHLMAPKFPMCRPGMIYSLARIFIHGDMVHLFFNLFTFHQLSPLFRSGNYVLLLTFLIAANAVLDFITFGSKLVPCSIGFSGVLFGLITYAYLSMQLPKGQLISSLFYLLLPSFLIPQLSLTGHLQGIATGFIAYWLGGMGAPFP